MYKGVLMRSRLEARFAAALDRGGYQWTYEPHCFADETGQYLPDFRVIGPDGPMYAEVKPPSINEDDLAGALSLMEIIWSSEPEAELCLFVWGAGRFYSTTHNLGGWILIDDAHPSSIFDTPYTTGHRREANGGP